MQKVVTANHNQSYTSARQYLKQYGIIDCSQYCEKYGNYRHAILHPFHIQSGVGPNFLKSSKPPIKLVFFVFLWNY